jgi:hypothetical protein
MALIEDIFKGNATTGLALGIGAVLLVPAVLPALGRVLRPAAKAAIKGGMVLYRETFAEIGEFTSDLVAEARAELESKTAPAAVTHEPVRASARTSPRGETH